MVSLDDELERIVSDQKRQAYKIEQGNILTQLKLRHNLAEHEAKPEKTKKKKRKKKKQKEVRMVTMTGNIVNSKKRRHLSNSNNTNRPPSSLASFVQYEFEWEAIEVGLILPEPKEEPVLATVATSSSDNDNDGDDQDYGHVHEYQHQDKQAPTKSRKLLLTGCMVLVVLVLILISVVVVLLWKRSPNDDETVNTPPPWMPPKYAVEFAPRTLVLPSGGSIIASELPAPLQFVSPSGVYQLSLHPQGEFTIRRKLNVTTSTTPDRSSDNTTFDRPRWRSLQATDDADEYYYYYDEDENKTDEEADGDIEYYYYYEENKEDETSGEDDTITSTTGMAPTDLASSSESSVDTNGDTVTAIEDTTIEDTAEDEPDTAEEDDLDDNDENLIVSSSVATITTEAPTRATGVVSVTDPAITDTTAITENWSDVVWRKEGFSDTTYIMSMEGGETQEVTRTIKLSMQTDGNFVLRDTVAGITVWKSLTKANPEAYMVFDDDGQIQVIDPTTGYPLYLDGIPRSQSQSFQASSFGNDDDDTTAKTTDSSTSGSGNLGPYPLRGIFYYPWFPTTWASDDNQLAHYIPKLGQYDSSHYPTIVNHAQQLDYGNIRLGISSWWGPDTKSDKARLLLMMDASYQVTDGRLKWCIYFEPQDGDDTVGGIRAKLDYLQDWFVDHPSYARTLEDNKPVIFVYNRNNKDFDYDCHTIAKCWNEANSKKEWHIVLKLFSGWRDCDYQPDSWHQYGPSTQFHYQDASNFAPGFVNISPGFWHAKESEPRLERLTSTEWTESVQRMSALRDVENNNIKWHLITSFNEAVEGTIIEATADWDTKSGMGYFLDVLHHN